MAELAGVGDGPPGDGRTAAEDERVVYHEAGHCVAALALGGRVKWATVNPSRFRGVARLGCVRFADGLTDTRRLIVLHAGPAGECAEIAGTDRTQADALTADPAAHRLAARVASRILTRNLAALHRLADALAERRTLDGLDVERACGPIRRTVTG